MGSARESWDSESDKRKADYVFMEALRQKALDNYNGYVELLGRAYELDTASTSVGQDLGYFYIMMSDNDTTMFNRGIQMMRHHFNVNPSDYYSSIFYGQIVDKLGIRDEALRVWSTMDSLFPDKPDITIKVAETLGQSPDSTDRRKALATIDRIESRMGKDLGLSSQRVRLLLTFSDTAAVLSEVKSLLEYSPRSAENHVYAGDVFMALHQPDSAIIYYNRACEVDSTSGLAYYRRADYYRQIDDSTAYDREVFQALRQADLDVDVKKEILTTYVRELYPDSLQHPRIDSIFTTVLSIHPREVGIRDIYAAYLAMNENYSAAAEQCDYALDIDPSNVDRWRTAISFHAQAGNYEAALDDGNKAVTYNPDNPILYLINGSSLIMLKRYGEAIEVLNTALENTDSLDMEMESNILSSIGDALYAEKDLDKAFEYYSRAINTDPTNYLAMNNCAYYMACEDIDLDRALSLIETAILHDPNNPTTLDTYAWVLFKRKDYPKAKEYIDRTLELSDGLSPELLEHAGDIYYMNGLPDEAVEYWEKAYDLDPDNDLLRRKVKNKAYYFK